MDNSYIKVTQSLIKEYIFHVHFHSEIVSYSLFRQVLHFKNKDNSLLALVLGTIPQTLKKSLMDGLTGALSSIGGAGLKDIDTSQSDGGPPIFSAMHFSCYNRNNMKVQFFFG